MRDSTMRDAILALDREILDLTPIQLISKAAVASNLEFFSSAISQAWPDEVDYYYAIKANPHPDILQKVISAGYGFECGGMQEIQLALDNNVRFIVNGSGKSSSILEVTAANNGVINVDSGDELDTILSLNASARIALRLKFVFTNEPENQMDFYFPSTYDSVNAYLRNKRWGMSLDEISTILTTGLPSRLTFEGIHIHLGKLGKTLASFELVANDLARQVNQLSAISKQEIKTINLGGGWNNSNPKPDGSTSFDMPELMTAFIESFRSGLKLKEFPSLIFEPGQAIVGSAGCTITTVTSTKFDPTSGIHWTHVDASTMTTNSVANSLQGSSYAISSLTSSSNEVIKTSIVGAPCMGSPFAVSVELPIPREGDLLAIWDTGAYSYGLQRDFNGYLGAQTLLLENLNNDIGEAQ
jgi:diaminopimelate decarboxylase